MKKWILGLFDRLRRWLLKRGYACDNCGAELFDYPAHRLCERCEEGLLRVKNPCPKCGRALVSQGTCLNCKSVRPRYDKGMAPFSYKGEAARFVNRMKNGYPRLAAYLGEQMARELLKTEREFSSPLLLVPVPLTAKRRRERGYNQAERLAEGVREYLTERGVEVELDFGVLTKERETKLQKQMSRREREENVGGAFLVRKRKTCRGRIVVLVDDICTTGATGSECAKKLRSAGAERVYFLTAAILPENK